MNAIYLHACSFSQSPWFAQLETYFLVETLGAISAALEHSDRLIDIASALCLVAVYQYANCRISEGYRHSFAAARLAINLGLHQISGPGSSPQDILFAVVPPARDGQELRDRMNVFWQVLIVDRSWSVASGLPAALPGDQTSETLKIKTPLPRPTTPGVSSPTLRDVALDRCEFYQTPFIPALRAEAVTLYERAYRISSCTRAFCSETITDLIYAHSISQRRALLYRTSRSWTSFGPIFFGRPAFLRTRPSAHTISRNRRRCSHHSHYGQRCLCLPPKGSPREVHVCF